MGWSSQRGTGSVFGGSKQGKEPKAKKKGGRLKVFLIGAAAGIALVVALQVSGVLAAFNVFGISDSGKSVTNIVVKEQLEEIGELATTSYQYTDIRKNGEDGFKIAGLIDLPFTSNEFYISYSGNIKAGVNMKDAKVSVSLNRVTIDLPDPKILSHEVDEDSVKYLDTRNSVFNPIEVTDRTEARKELKAYAEQKARDGGLLERADGEARASVEAFCRSFLPDGYKVTIK